MSHLAIESSNPQFNKWEKLTSTHFPSESWIYKAHSGSDFEVVSLSSKPLQEICNSTRVTHSAAISSCYDGGQNKTNEANKLKARRWGF